jgi:cell division protein FtsB
MSYNRGLQLVVKAKDQVVPPREETGRTEPGSRRKAWVLGTVIALIALAVGGVFGDRGVLNLVEKRKQVDALRLELDALRADNARLAAEIADLRTSPRPVERLAREELGLARPDETVFLIREEDATASR